MEIQVNRDLDNKSLVIEFVVDAAKDMVWRIYADKETFERWWGPEGWVTTTKAFEFKPGGRVHYAMKCVDENQGEWFGKESWGIMDIQSIDEGKSFTYLDHFSDEHGEINREMPSLTITNEFIEEDGKTRVISRCRGERPEQIEELIKMGMIDGFKSQLNKLERLMKE